MMRRTLLVAGMLAAGAGASAQQIVRSPSPGSVDVTVYRAPQRPAGEPINLRWLNGFALISETRTVRIPAGESDIRFEGVAGGILPESAIVTGLPNGVVEKNQDAMLLSPGSLLDASLGRRVHLRRTSRATGAVREVDAVIRSAERGAVVLETEAGIETLRCTGLPETLVYDRVPPDLSAKPTLSVKVRSPRPAAARVILSYLASDFDWEASYVATLAPDGTAVDLFAWLTLANGDETGFREADTQAVAGRLKRTAVRAPKARAQPLTLECWPRGTTTSDLREVELEHEDIVVTGTRFRSTSPAPPPPPPAMAIAAGAMMAQQEDIGDLKLYRIPEPVTVAAKSQKQIALLARKNVKVETVYRQTFHQLERAGSDVTLGLPLPSGRIAFYAESGTRSLLVGRGSVADHAVGEKVELGVSRASAIDVQVRPLSPSNAPLREWEITVSNAFNAPVRYEARFGQFADKLQWDTPLVSRDGWRIWETTVPANGRVTLRVRGSNPGS